MLKPLDGSNRNTRHEVKTASCSCSLDIQKLVSDHHEAVFRYAYRLSGRVDDAEDLTQQTFLVAQQRLYQVREPDKVVRWLFAILRSCYLKSRRQSRPVAASDIELDVACIPQQAEDQSIDEELLQKAIDDLPDPLKIVLVMFYFERASYREIADALECPIGTVMSRLSRAKGKLRHRLLVRKCGAGKSGTQSSGSS